MHFDYDAIVVGARCAGASTAMLLARKGHRVLLVDRARFPSDIPHGHFIHRHGPPRLSRWGLLDKVVASGCPPVMAMTSYFGDFRLTAENLESGGVAWGYGPRRAVLDKILLDAALAAGVDLLEATSVDSLLTDGSRVVGIRTTHDKRIRARLTIGADGKHSRVAREVGAQEFEAVPTLTCWYFSYFQDVPDPCFEMHLLPQRRVVFAHPTNDGLMAVFVGAPIEEFGCIRADPEAAFLRAIDMAPGLGARLRDGFRAERLYGTGDIPNFLRKPFGPGWALVGDAACHKDPFLAMGICDALRDAELLAEAAHAGLSGALRMENALAEYRACRDKQTLPDYQENVHMARLGPIPADVLLLRQALKNKPAEATRFVLASHGRIPREEFFNPEHLDQLLGA